MASSPRLDRLEIMVDEIDPNVLVPAYKLIIELQKENARLNRMCGQLQTGMNQAKQSAAGRAACERQNEALRSENNKLVDMVNQLRIRLAIPLKQGSLASDALLPDEQVAHG